MIRGSLRPYYWMGSLIVVLLAVTAGAGVTVEGLYRPFLSEPLVAFQFFQDLLSLVCAPVLALAMVMTARGSVRAFVIWAGLLVYVLYYYAFYALDPVYTVYYPLYLALMGLSAYSLIGMLASVDLEVFRRQVDEGMPVRFISIVLGTTLLFVPIWLILMARDIAAQQPSETFLVAFLDLPFLIPACVIAAVQIWQRRPMGYLLAGILLLKATMSGILLTGGELFRMQRGLPPALEQLVMYVFLAVAGSVGLALYLRHLYGGRDARIVQYGRPTPRPLRGQGRRTQ